LIESIPAPKLAKGAAQNSFCQEFKDLKKDDNEGLLKLYLKVLDATDLTKKEKEKVKSEIESHSHMVMMIFKFYLQSNEYDFFIKRLRNVTGSSYTENFGKQVTNQYYH